MPLADFLPWNIAEARRSKQAPAQTPARSDPDPGVLPNRTGFVQGVPRGGFGESDAQDSTGAAQNTSRGEFLQELWEEYLRCPWAFASVNAIARTVTAGGPVMKWDADTGAYGQKQPDKPANVLALERLFAFCNDTQDIRQLSRNVVADLQVFADAYIEVVWFAGIPVALYNQDCPTTFPETDDHGNVKRYLQKTEDGRTATFRPEQIIHFTLDSARPSVFGLSPTHAAEESIVNWMFLHACMKESARRGLPPNVHIDHPAGTPDTDVQRHQDQYATRNIGPANIGTPITTKGGGTVKELQTAKLTDILSAKKDARDEIIAAYGVPPAKLGIIESGNLGGGTGSDQNKTFMLDVVRPVAMLIAEKLQFHLAARAFGVKGWHVEFPTTDYRDDKTIADIQDQQTRLGARTLNDLRQELGRPAVEGGDDAVLVARQDIVLWSDMAARSSAAVAALGGGGSGEPGPPPAAGTQPSKGQGGAPSESAIAEAVILYLRREGVLEHTPALTTGQRARNQMLRTFAPASVKWASDPDVLWDGPVMVPLHHIATEDLREWTATHDGPDIKRLRRKLRKTGKLRTVILARAPGSTHDTVIDGHHHVLAAMEEGATAVRAYVAHVPTVDGPWLTMATRQQRESLESARDGTITKAEANYGPATSPGVTCGNCSMYDDGRCSLVRGDIAIDATCAQWEPDVPATSSAA